MQLAGKVCLVTGGTRGIGAAAAIAFAEQGAAVSIVGRHEDDDARQTLQTLRGLNSRCICLLGDMAKGEDCRRVVQQTVERLGGLDVLVHAAGGPVPGDLMQLTDEAWYQAFDVHVHAIFHLVRAAIPHMKPRKEGAIILIGSTAGIRAIRTAVAYQAVKGAIPQLTRALAWQFADDNIRVNCVNPGVVRTRFHESMTEQTRRNNIENRIPLHREGTPGQIATVIRELVTNDYITGESVVVDGGLTMRIC